MSEPELADLLREHAAAHSVPGAAVGILRDGALTTAYHGVADSGTVEPVTSETRFSPGSLTKSMVATVIARLAQDSRLSLDDPVSAHVPELSHAEWAGRASIRDLLANRSGLPLRDDLEFDFAREEDEADAALSRFSSRIGAVEPAAGLWSYTNAGWSLLGRTIETVTGRTWEDAMGVELFAPAGMAQTTFSTRPVREPRVSGHELGEDGPAPVEPLEAPAYGPAGASLLSTVDDMLRFAALHLDDRSLDVLRETQAEIAIHAWFDAWCCGWARFDWDGGPVWGWDGLINGERSVLRLVPKQRAAVVLLTNCGTGRAMYRSLFAELMPAFFGVTMPTLSLEPSVGAAGELTRFAGVYAWPDSRYEVTAEGEALVIESAHGVREALPLDQHTFLVDAADPDVPSVTFADFDEDGRPHVLYQMLWGHPRSAA